MKYHNANIPDMILIMTFTVEYWPVTYRRLFLHCSKPIVRNAGHPLNDVPPVSLIRVKSPVGARKCS